MTDERQSVRIVVFDGEQYEGDWPTPGYPATLVRAIEWFQAKLAEIPAPYRESARCEIDSASWYEGSHCGRIRIDYDRPETDEEMDLRLRRHQLEAEMEKRAEIRQLQMLKSRYPDV